jgi:hypothetical protein
MMEPRRLIEECSEPFERAVLRAGFDVKAAPESRARARELLGLTAAPAPRIFAFLPRKKTRLLLAAAAVTTMAAALPLAYYATRASAPSGTAQLSTKNDTASSSVETPLGSKSLAGDGSGNVSKDGQRVTAPPSPDEAPVDVEGLALEADHRKPTSSAAEASAKAAEPNRLSLELKALDSARRRLQSGDALGALQQLEVYEREFPQPRLAPEAEVVRIFAYDKAGQKDTARRRAMAFVARYPKGVLTARVRRYLQP